MKFTNVEEFCVFLNAKFDFCEYITDFREACIKGYVSWLLDRDLSRAGRNKLYGLDEYQRDALIEREIATNGYTYEDTNGLNSIDSKYKHYAEELIDKIDNFLWNKVEEDETVRTTIDNLIKNNDGAGLIKYMKEEIEDCDYLDKFLEAFDKYAINS